MLAQEYMNRIAGDFKRAKSLPKLVGLTGKAGSGKDTIADFLVHKYAYRKYSLAGPIKRMLAALFNLPELPWGDRDWKEKPIVGNHSPRVLAQTLGTEWGRSLSDSFWLDMFRREWDQWKNYPTGVVVSDIRFNNEAQYIRSLGGCVVVIERGSIQAVADHVSEKGIRKNKRDITLSNSSDIRGLQDAAELALADWSQNGPAKLR